MADSDDQSPKAVVEGYGPAPFAYAQTNDRDGSIRLVAWSGKIADLKRLVYAVLRLFSANVNVLLKVEKQDTADGPVWTRYHGEAPLAKVVQAIESNERLIFQDGYTQLCVRDADTGEYFALDEYGVLYIYSDDDRFVRACRECGFEDLAEDLISERAHWRRSLEDAADLREGFIRTLALAEVE